MILQAASGHKFVDQKAVFVFKAIPNQFYKMGMRKLSKIVHFSLQANRKTEQINSS